MTTLLYIILDYFYFLQYPCLVKPGTDERVQKCQLQQMLMNVGSGGKYDDEEENVLGLYSDSFPLSLASW